MSEDMRPGGSLVDSWRSLQPDQALQPLEAEFNAPSQTIESENVGCREVFRPERGHQNDPIGGVERLPGKLMTAPLRLPPRLAPCLSRCLDRLLDGDQPQRQRCAALGFYPNRAIDQAAPCRLAQLSHQIDRTALAIEPVGALPAGADDEVRAGVEQLRHPARLQVGPVGDADLAPDHRYAVKCLARRLIGQFEMAKTLPWKIECAVNAPQLIALPGVPSSLRYRRGVDNPDQAASARLRGSASKYQTHQQRQPIPALTQAIQQSHVGDVDQADRCCPCRGQPQPSLAKAISQDQPQQVHRIADLARTHKGLRLARSYAESLRSTEPDHHFRPVLVHNQFVLHSTLESQMHRCHKSYFSAYGRRPGPITTGSRCCGNADHHRAKTISAAAYWSRPSPGRR